MGRTIVVVGAGGFIGQAVCRALRGAGLTPRAARLQPVTDWERPEAWAPWLANAQGVVYAAGCLRDQAAGVQGLLDLLHHRAPAALLDACDAAGIGRLVHLSALCGGISAYARSKHAGEVALAGRAWVVRPSLVVGPGGISSRMLDRLARLPWLPLPAAVAACRVQPIHVDDLAAGIVALLDASGPAAGVWTAVGPESATVADWITRRRAARGLDRAHTVTLPESLTRATARMGDWLPLGPWCSTALALLGHDSVGDANGWPLGHPLRDPVEGAWA